MTETIRIVPFGQYDLELKLAHGGMAEVFLGTDRTMGPNAPKVVIKRILPDLAKDSRFVAMFINEAQLAAQMDHENIVRVISFGEENGRLYMVMEFVEGLDCWRLSRRLHPWGENHVALSIMIIQKVLGALTYAYNLKDVNNKSLYVIHRDLSPSNIYISLDGEVKLGDFGIARIESTRYRPIGVIPKGKFGYMAPEQVEDGIMDQRADVYSAGVVLTELLLGQKLFTGNSQLSVMLDIKDGRLDILNKNIEMIPSGLVDVLRFALSLKPVDRFKDAAQFSEALTTYMEATKKIATPKQLAEQLNIALDIRDARSLLGNMSYDNADLTPDPNKKVNATPRTDPEATNVQIRLGAQDDEVGTPITVENNHLAGEGRYMARIADTTIGPTSYAHIIELICSDRITANTLVSLDGRNYSPAKDIPEMARHLPTHTPTYDGGEVTTPDRRGLLDLEVPSEVLLLLAVSKESGLLVCQQETLRKEIYIQHGHPVYVGSNNPNELLGELLVKNDIIERTELEMALALLPKFSGHLGDTLIALGMLSAVDLFNQISIQVKHRLTDLLNWNNGSYEFYSGVDCRVGVLEIKINSFDFIRENMLTRIQNIDGSIFDEMHDTAVAPTALMSTVIDRLGFPSEIDEKIRSLGSWSNLSDFVHAAGDAQMIILARTLYVALETGLWTFDGKKPPWR